MLDKMMNWLQTFPQWKGQLQLDYMDTVPGSAGLYPKGLTELSRKEDVLGNTQVQYRCDFLLRTAAGSDRARWLLDFQNWVTEQDRLGLAPRFGDEPKTEHIRAYEGQLHSHKQVGSGVYTLQISAEFTKIDRGE